MLCQTQRSTIAGRKEFGPSSPKGIFALLPATDALLDLLFEKVVHMQQQKRLETRQGRVECIGSESRPSQQRQSVAPSRCVFFNRGPKDIAFFRGECRPDEA